MTLGYWIESPGRGALRDVDVVAPDDAALELEAVCSGVSSIFGSSAVCAV